jgi:hypothetical protein
MADPEQSPQLVAAKNWAKQSIAFALILRATKAGEPIDSQEKSVAANDEAISRVDELWEQTVTSSGADAASNESILAFAQIVHAWCHEDMQSS